MGIHHCACKEPEYTRHQDPQNELSHSIQRQVRPADKEENHQIDDRPVADCAIDVGTESKEVLEFRMNGEEPKGTEDKCQEADDIEG